jgi:type III restriction enzyme
MLQRYRFYEQRYLKEDGLPALYSPDFLVRTADSIYLVETKAQQQTIRPNVQRKLKAAVIDRPKKCLYLGFHGEFML